MEHPFIVHLPLTLSHIRLRIRFSWYTLLLILAMANEFRRTAGAATIVTFNIVNRRGSSPWLNAFL